MCHRLLTVRHAKAGPTRASHRGRDMLGPAVIPVVAFGDGRYHAEEDLQVPVLPAPGAAPQAAYSNLRRIGRSGDVRKGATLKLSQANPYPRFKRSAVLVSALLALVLFPLPSRDAAHAQSNTSPTLPAPTLTARIAGATSVDLSWTSVSGAVGYELWVWWQNDPGWQRLGEGSLTGTSHTHSDLTAGRTYYYLVAALDGGGIRGQWSEQRSVTLPAQSQPLSAPQLTASPSGSTAIDVGWNAVVGAVRYELWTWWDRETGWQQLGGGSLTGTAYSHSGLTPGRTYYYTIAAIDSAGVRGTWSAQIDVTLPGPPTALPAPSLTVTSTVTATAEISWTGVTGAGSYQLWEWKNAVNDWERLDQGNLTGTSFVRTGATPGQTCYYAVAAMDENGILGAWSQVVSVIVSDAPANPDNANERAALAVLYQSTGGANWVQKDNWLSSASIATWYGVKTDDEGRVQELTLSGNGLSGSLPDLSALSNLTVLALDFNQLTGPVPDLGALTELEWLSVSSNQLTGSIPVLNTLTNLEVLDLGFNQLTGSIPDLSSLTNLNDLSLADNRLNGSVPDLRALTNLTELHLGTNQLTGPIPDLSALTGLTVLSLSGNQLSGSIPDLNSLSNLTDLYLEGNQLTGIIPSLSALTKLAWIDLSSNRLSGQIPDVGALVNLRHMLLARNQLAGPIPNLAALAKLTNLSLANNLLSGTIPALGSLASLYGVDLSNNQLTGQIPDLGSLTNLSQLNLARNHLTGSIPALAALTSLTDLDLGSNRLTGAIPDLRTLTSLTSLILASNQLTGPVPDLSALTNLSTLDLSANQLCLPDHIDPADANAVVSAHLSGLNLPPCPD